MTAQKGYLLLLKVGNGGGPETFATIGGLRTTEFRLQNRVIETNSLQSGSWRKLSDGVGIKDISISGSGFFSDSASEETFRGYAFSGSVKNYELTFGNGDKLSGPFLISNYERSGDYDSEENYAIQLESAGTITFTTG